MVSIKGRVARRMFALFLACAVVPIAALGSVSLFHVSRQLDDHSRERLSTASKMHGMGLYDRLRAAESELRFMATALADNIDSREYRGDPTDRIDAAWLLVDDAPRRILVGEPSWLPPLSSDLSEHLATGASAVVTSGDEGDPVRVLLLQHVTTTDGTPVRLAGSIRPAYLWGFEGLSAMTDLAVLDDTGRVLVTSASLPDVFTDGVAGKLAMSSVGRLEWSNGSDEYVASFWSLFLRFRYDAPSWTVVLSEPRAYTLGPLLDFRGSFVWVTLLSVLTVSLVSLVQIRRRLVPLEALREGTQRIAARDFDARVTVTSDDEFHDLADSFNGMAGQLGKQFRALTTIHEIDKAILSKLRTADIVHTVLVRMPTLLRCDGVAVGLLEADERTATVHVRIASDLVAVVDETSVDADDLSRMESTDPCLIDRLQGADTDTSAPSTLPGYLRPLGATGMNAFLTFPLRAAGRVTGFVSLGMRHDLELDDEDVRRARQVADQIGVALANARLEQQLVQAQRMEGIGMMAGGIAHDFNNVLTTILGYSDMILVQIDESNPIWNDVHQIRNAGERAASLTRQLLAFSRQQVLKMTVLDLNAVVRDLQQMLQRLLGEHIAIETHLAGDLQHIKADASQLEQILVNLAVNGRDAMGRGGTLAFETANTELKYTQAADLELPAGPYTMLTVTDTGCGMDEHTRARIFDPFFTTKEMGKGTGLGLSTVYGTVRQLGGSISVATQPQQGTTFTIYLPQTDEYLQPVPERPDGSLVVGKETVLLVEDDEAVRAFATTVLRQAGYSVREAATPQEALAISRDADVSFDLVLTDVVMPGMNGRQMVDHLQAHQPHSKVLYTSGYDESVFGRGDLSVADHAFLPKPFTADVLLGEVRQVLDADTVVAGSLRDDSVASVG